MYELQLLGWCEIGALSISPAEVKVMGPERKKLEEKSRRLCSLAVGAVGWFGLMWVFFCFSPAMLVFFLFMSLINNKATINN